MTTLPRTKMYQTAPMAVMPTPMAGGYDFASRAVGPSPNYPLSDLTLWHAVGSAMRNFAGSIAKPMGGAKDFAYLKGFNLDQGIGNAVIVSGPTAYLWGNISGIS